MKPDTFYDLILTKEACQSNIHAFSPTKGGWGAKGTADSHDLPYIFLIWVFRLRIFLISSGKMKEYIPKGIYSYLLK